ncbi:MAG TPA: TIGR02569 family protein [Pseudonocardia sp.]|nr:TIGR02569 family protein [Pseudonocardia sp.]
MHVRSAFGVRDVPVVPLLTTAMPAWRCGEILIRPVRDTALASWSAGVLDTLAADGLRIARPLRGSDGRWVVAGFSACQYITGSAEPRFHDMVAASLRLHAATASVRRPRLLDDRDDLVARADAAAWGERVIRLAPGAGGDLFNRLAERRQQLRSSSQVVHGDLFGTLLFDGERPPGLLELVPFWRPVEWAAAVIVVDALAWGGAPEDLVDQWAHLDAWPQSLLRALLFRLALHAQHPGATTESLRGLEYAAEVVGRRV